MTLPVLLGVAFSASAQVSILDGFEGNEGRFTSTPSTSGTTAGETETSAGVGPSTAVLSTLEFHSGSGGQALFIDDDPAADSPAGGAAWRLRHLSGGGTPANNATLTTSGFVGYWLKTSTPDLRAGILIDDGAALELSTRTAITADGQWHFYEWDFDNAAHWDAFAGTAPDGAINAATATIDAIFIDVVKTSGDQDATFFIDDVSHNPTGSISVPEPATAGLLTAVSVPTLLRRSRRWSKRAR